MSAKAQQFPVQSAGMNGNINNPVVDPPVPGHGRKKSLTKASELGRSQIDNPAVDGNRDGEEPGASFPARVILSHRDNGQVKKVTQEVFMLKCGFQNRNDLMVEIKRNFDNLENSMEKRADAPSRCLWGDKYVAESMEINWKPNNPAVDNAWANPTALDVSSDLTDITDLNIGTSLAILKNNGNCALSVLVQRVPVLFESAPVVE
jgi:hypothetical protein